MGKAWKNPIKVANSAKKGITFSKLAKEIQVAAKLGGIDIQMNPRLRLAIDAAKAESCPKDTIQRAINKGAGLLKDEAQLKEVLYEGFGPGKIGVLVQCHTDNKARTATDIKVVFNKNNGCIAESGSVEWMFHRVGLIKGFNTNIDIEEEAIKAGALDVESFNAADSGASFYTEPNELDIVRKILVERGWTIKVMELSYKVKNIIQISDEDNIILTELLKKLNENKDSYRVYSTAGI